MNEHKFCGYCGKILDLDNGYDVADEIQGHSCRACQEALEVMRAKPDPAFSKMYSLDLLNLSSIFGTFFSLGIVILPQENKHHLYLLDHISRWSNIKGVFGIWGVRHIFWANPEAGENVMDLIKGKPISSKYLPHLILSDRVTCESILRLQKKT